MTKRRADANLIEVNYRFRGYVQDIEGDSCRVVMRDITDPKNPDEEWTVETAKIGLPLVVGQYVSFTIHGERGRFTVDRRTVTVEAIARAKKRAEKWIAMFGLPQADDAVDPHASSTGTPSTRD